MQLVDFSALLVQEHRTGRSATLQAVLDPAKCIQLRSCTCNVFRMDVFWDHRGLKDWGICRRCILLKAVFIVECNDEYEEHSIPTLHGVNLVLRNINKIWLRVVRSTGHSGPNHVFSRLAFRKFLLRSTDRPASLPFSPSTDLDTQFRR